MTKISKELIEWAIHKIETEYSEDVSLLIGHSHWNIKPDGNEVAFNFFIPETKAGYKLAQTFIIDGIGYDLFPMSWERVEGLANINESLTTCLADGVILYAKSDVDRERFIQLQNKLQDNLADPSFTYKKGLEKINTAMELYKTMLFENSLGSGRKASGFIADYLSQAVATVNGVYFKRGPENQISHLAEMDQVPENFMMLFESLIAAKSLETIKTLCYQMIETTRAFFEAIMPEKKQSPQEYNYEDLACWYEEGVYTFRRIYYYAAQKDVFNAFAWGYHFQREFDAIEEEFGLEPMDLMGVFDPENLDAFAARAKAIDASIRGEIEKRGVTLREYDSLDAFWRRSAHKGADTMKYLNAADILPDKLLREVQKYARGEALYIPMAETRKKWGEGSGARSYYELRNDEIRRKFAESHDLEALAEEYNLAFETVRKIVYK